MSDSAARDEYDALFDLDKRGSKHPEDQDDKFSASLARSDDEDTKYGKGNLREKKKTPESEDEDDAPSSSKMRSRYFLPRGSHLSSNANTGPKGVIADAYAFETAKETAKKSRRLSFLPGKRVSSFKPTPPPAQYRREPEKSEGSEEEDDDFMQEWRQARLRELQQAAIPGQEARRHSPSGRRWGTVQTVDGEAFLDAVEKSPKDAVVVTLIYDDASEVSNMVESAFRQLAKAHTSTRFIRLHYEEAEMEQMGVPAILAYRDGEKFAGLVPVVDEIPEEMELDADSVEMAMRKHQIFT